MALYVLRSIGLRENWRQPSDRHLECLIEPKIFHARFLIIMVDNKPWCQNCHSSWYKLWKTSAIGSHNLFWIKTYKLVFLCKIVVDTYHEWENIFQLWERYDQRCQRVHHKFIMHTLLFFSIKDHFCQIRLKKILKSRAK